MITVHQLTKSFGTFRAVDHLSLSVASGELYALLGPNGAGKSTTLQCLLGFLEPDEGEILIGGVDGVKLPSAARDLMAFIPEQVNLYPYFSGVENLIYFTELSGRNLTPNAAKALLAEVGLQSEAHERRVQSYSKGMRQKVGIAIALAKEAKVLLLDEPTSGLDPSASHEFSRLLGRLRQQGVAILMATHDLFRAREDASQIGIMRHGRLQREFKAKDLSAADLEQLYLETMSD